MKPASLLIVISNVLIASNSLAWAQFTVLSQQKLTIIPPPHSLNGTEYIESLKQKINLTQIDFLDLIRWKKDNADFFQNSNLASFSELIRLTMDSCEIDTLPETALAGLSKLNYLNISSSGIQKIPADLLHYTPSLQEIILINNKFSELPANMFQNISAVLNLDLHSNELVSIHREAFLNLEILYQLFLNNNKLITLGQGVFHDLGSRLGILDLSFNQIGHFDDQIFATLDKLTDLLLVQAFSANVTTLPSNIFAHLANVEVLKLDGNNLEYLPEDIFHQNRMLQTLSIANNKLTSLKDATFQQNTELQSLYLNDNQLNSLSENLFNNLTELRELYLQNNKLSSLSPFIFSPLTHLRTIWISNNSVTMEGPRQNVSSLYNCHNIENIHATNNSISRIYDDWIEKDEKLNVLDLRSNPMSETKIEPIHFLSDHVSIYLNDLNAPEMKLRKLTMLKLDDYADKKFIMDKNAACGSNCACVIDLDYQNQRMVLKCVRYNEKELIEKIPSYIVKFAANLNVELNLSKCNLTSLYPLRGWLQQLNVTKLSLSDNQLSHLDGLPELPKLKILELHNNQFTSIDKKTLGILTRASRLGMFTLHDNPWICEGSSKKFFEFLVKFNTVKKIAKPNKITCDNVNQKPLLEFAENLFREETNLSLNTKQPEP